MLTLFITHTLYLWVLSLINTQKNAEKEHSFLYGKWKAKFELIYLYIIWPWTVPDFTAVDILVGEILENNYLLIKTSL